MAQEGEEEEDISEDETDREIFDGILRESNGHEANFTSQCEVQIDEK